MNPLYYVIGGVGSLAALFIGLFIKSAITNGKLRNENEALKKQIEATEEQLKEQLRIAAQPTKSPSKLIKDMKENKL